MVTHTQRTKNGPSKKITAFDLQICLKKNNKREDSKPARISELPTCISMMTKISF